MKIMHIANFYGPKSGGIRTTLHELGKGYISKGHEFVYVYQDLVSIVKKRVQAPELRSLPSFFPSVVATA